MKHSNRYGSSGQSVPVRGANAARKSAFRRRAALVEPPLIEAVIAAAQQRESETS
jgi:hypothetical protein